MSILRKKCCCGEPQLDHCPLPSECKQCDSTMLLSVTHSFVIPPVGGCAPCDGVSFDVVVSKAVGTCQWVFDPFTVDTTGCSWIISGVGGLPQAVGVFCFESQGLISWAVEFHINGLAGGIQQCASIGYGHVFGLAPTIPPCPLGLSFDGVLDDGFGGLANVTIDLT